MEEVNTFKNKIKKFFKVLGPGFISGAADDDPTAIATYTQAGARFGYSQLWTSIYAIPFMIAVQEMCGRIGMVTGKGLSGVIKHHYPRPVLYLCVILLLISNIINIGADLGAMAASAGLLINVSPIIWLILLAVITLSMEIFISYEKYSNYLKYLTIALLGYIAVVFLVKVDWPQVIISIFVPSLTLSSVYLLNLVAILGTNISPYLFFWQAGEEVEEEVEHHRIQAMGRGVPKVTSRDLRELKLDTAVGMIFSNIVILFVGISAAATLGVNGIADVQTPAQAAQALRPLAGNLSSWLFAIGIIGSGLLVVPILAGSASYALTETLGWREGLYRKFTQALGFYGIIIVSTLIGLLVNLIGIEPFRMLIYAAAINGVLAPPLLVMILLICNNSQIMGKFVNRRLSNLVGVSITVLMILASGWLIYSFFI